ncbi:LysM domain-containing protein/Pkinase_Tyr domain-containing protein [Cephalotus follicularis]|uniref:LysM domain-containing protein/Pkinase_Tyr domain-containing protein n=1 Tax=Cephalotus follicularis TaxID=3775 RepID=A0A1Q3B044_CEPFO|nr:LysM domain-containing protein/Pkinase_Tyr domain-containing protein [Cephalotus follicularis]
MITSLPLSVILVLFSSFLQFHSLNSYPIPMNCTDTTRLCISFLAFKPEENQTLSIIQSMFDVLPQDITKEEGNIHNNYVFIKKNCSCLSTTKNYVTNTTYTVRSNDGYVYDMVVDSYGGLALLPNITRPARVGAVVSVRLFCGCSSGLWNYLMSYVMRDGDSVASLASRFGVSMDSIEQVNGIVNPDNVTVGALYYIPLNSVPGEPFPVDNDIHPTPVPAPSADNFAAIPVPHKDHVPYVWIIGSLGIGLLVILLGVVAFVFLRSSCCLTEARGNLAKDPDGKISHKFHILRNPSFCCASGRYICCKLGDWKQTNGESRLSSNHENTIPKAVGTDVFDMEKPVVFTYEEILYSTDGFSDSSLLGQGTYGSVYYGLLHDQEVAIKRLTATKTKEFMAELRVLCKVHHTNLVELIGYAASDDEFFLIYECAQKGSLRCHLHDHQNKGHTSLSWIMRVQIALDAARGLEYIHEHTKTHYVHRDIKTSNILLDSSFRAKISDFGLAKLVGKTSDGEASTTKVVGTFGYLAPEYLSNGLATTKSDVYAFGVVLFEILSGKEAIIRTEGMTTKTPERRSLASVMLAALRNVPDSMSMSSMKNYADPNMMDLYPHDCFYKMAMLAKQCVDEDPILRPDMKQVVISLSQILLTSVEWEATLAGNSQIFSGLVQGR